MPGFCRNKGLRELERNSSKPLKDWTGAVGSFVLPLLVPSSFISASFWWKQHSTSPEDVCLGTSWIFCFVSFFLLLGHFLPHDFTHSSDRVDRALPQRCISPEWVSHTVDTGTLSSVCWYLEMVRLDEGMRGPVSIFSNEGDQGFLFCFVNFCLLIFLHALVFWLHVCLCAWGCHSPWSWSHRQLWVVTALAGNWTQVL